MLLLLVEESELLEDECGVWVGGGYYDVMQQSTATCRAQPRQVDDGERVRPIGRTKHRLLLLDDDM